MKNKSLNWVRVFILILLFGANFLFAQQGSTAAQFLKIGVDARSAGMGEAGIADVSDVSAVFWNPARLVYVPGISVMLSHLNWIGEISHNFAGLVLPLRNSVIGINLIVLDLGETEITTLEQPRGTGSFYDASDFSLGITYSRWMTDKFSVGISAKYIRQSIRNEVANGIAFDIGTSLNVGISGLNIAMALTNYGAGMRMRGDDLIIPFSPGPAATPIKAQLETLEFPLPTNFRIGIAFQLVGPKSVFMASESSQLLAVIDGNHPIDEVERGNFGLEYSWREMAMLRVGYKYRYSEQGLTFGGGVRLLKISIDYALTRFGLLGNVSRFTASIRF